MSLGALQKLYFDAVAERDIAQEANRRLQERIRELEGGDGPPGPLRPGDRAEVLLDLADGRRLRATDLAFTVSDPAYEGELEVDFELTFVLAVAEDLFGSPIARITVKKSAS